MVAHPGVAEGGGMALDEIGPVDYAIVADERLFNGDDVLSAAAELEPGSSAAMIVWENLWATKIADAVRAADGVLVDFGRIPHATVKAANEFRGVAA
jgi:hypothetical protein